MRYLWSQSPSIPTASSSLPPGPFSYFTCSHLHSALPFISFAHSIPALGFVLRYFRSGRLRSEQEEPQVHLSGPVGFIEVAAPTEKMQLQKAFEKFERF